MKQLPEAPKTRSYNWIIVIISVLAMLGCAYAGIMLHRGSDQPVIDPGVMVSEEPTPEPTVYARPTAAPIITPEPEPEETPEPTQQVFVKTSVVIDGKVYLTLSSLQAAEELLRNVEYYFTSLDLIPAGAVTTLINTVEFAPADENAKTTDYDSAFKKLTGSNTPLSFESVAVFIQEEIIEHTTDTEYTDCLPEGMRAVLRYGMDGLRRKTFSSTYVNGVRKLIIETENNTVYPAVNGHILIGTAKYETSSEQDSFDGKLPQLPQVVSFVSPLKGKLYRDFGSYPDGFHAGIDLEAAAGSPVVAACGGTVVAIMERGSYGLMIDILHDGGITSRYSHLGKAIVSLGDIVSAGDIIGTVAEDYSVSHLHFEVRYRCVAYDPKLCFADPGVFASD